MARSGTWRDPWPEVINNATYGRIHIMRRFEDDALVFKFEKDGVVIVVNPHDMVNPSTARIIEAMKTERARVDKFGRRWLATYESARREIRACR